jgi:hypothetical protein
VLRSSRLRRSVDGEAVSVRAGGHDQPVGFTERQECRDVGRRMAGMVDLETDEWQVGTKCLDVGIA